MFRPVGLVGFATRDEASVEFGSGHGGQTVHKDAEQHRQDHHLEDLLLGTDTDSFENEEDKEDRCEATRPKPSQE